MEEMYYTSILYNQEVHSIVQTKIQLAETPNNTSLLLCSLPFDDKSNRTQNVKTRRTCDDGKKSLEIISKYLAAYQNIPRIFRHITVYYTCERRSSIRVP